MMFDIHTEDNSKTGDHSTKPGSLRGKKISHPYQRLLRVEAVRRLRLHVHRHVFR